MRFSARVWFVLALLFCAGSGVHAAGLASQVPLGEQQIAGASAFFQLLGHVRYFHPAEEAREVDWNRFAVDHVKGALAASSPEELAEYLEAAFAPIAPTVQVYPSHGAASEPVARDYQEEAARVIMYVWIGQDSESSSRLLPAPRQLHIDVAADAPCSTGMPVDFPLGMPHLAEFIEVEVVCPEDPVVLSLPGGVTASVPISAYESGSGHTLPIVMSEPGRDDSSTATDLAVRLAVIGLAWAALEHYFPYWDVVDVDWEGVLPRFLARAARAGSLKELMVELKVMTALPGDGHTHTGHTVYSDVARFFPPFTADIVEGRLTVTTVMDDAPEALVPGVILEAIAGEPVQDGLRRLAARTAGAGQWHSYRVIEALLGQETAGELEVSFSAPGSSKVEAVRVSTSRVHPGFARENRPPVVAALGEDLLYLDLTRADRQQVLDVLRGSNRDAGLVVDLRGYPASEDAVLTFLAHVATSPLCGAALAARTCVSSMLIKRWARPENNNGLVG